MVKTVVFLVFANFIFICSALGHCGDCGVGEKANTCSACSAGEHGSHEECKKCNHDTTEVHADGLPSDGIQVGPTQKPILEPKKNK